MIQTLEKLKTHFFSCQAILLFMLSASAIAQPSITNFSPASGPVGTTVTINGTGFNATPSNNIVYFGATQASVTSATTTQLTVTVPVGATYQSISVLVNGLIGYSKLPFATTYVGWDVIDAGSFVSKTELTCQVASSPSISVGDFDGDGKTDLAVANFGSSTVSIFRNTSSGAGIASYAGKIDYTVNNALSVSVGDIDGDGKLDLIVTTNIGTVSVLRNTSTGVGSVSFAAKVDFITSTTSTNFVSIGDFDRDGRADLAVVNNSFNTVSVLRNTGTGAGSVNFAAKVDYTVGTTPNSVSIADIDGDGKSDMAVTNIGSNTVSIFRNTSTAVGSVSFAQKIDYPITSPKKVSFGDVDGDGNPEMIMGSSSNAVSVFRNTSVVGSVSFATKVDFALEMTPATIAVGDLDGDGKPDLAVASSNANSISVFRNTSPGIGSVSYAAKVDYVMGTNTTTNSVAIGDFDSDGKMDMAAGNWGITSISVILHPTGARQTIASFDPIPSKTYGDPAFSLNATASSSLPVTYSSSNPSVATVTGNTVTIVGYGTATITASQTGDSYYGPVSVSQVLTVGPFPSITSFTPTSGPVGTTVTINGSGFNATPANNIVYFGSTKATVTVATTTQLTVTVPVGASYQPITVLTNGLITYSGTSFATTYVGWGVIDAGSFVSKIDLPSASGPFSVSAGDFDGDGKTDLAVVNNVGNSVSVFRNTSAGAGSTSFAGKVDYTTGLYPYSVSTGDFDGDGKMDLVVANYNSNSVSIFRNTSTGPGSVSFAAKVDFTTGTIPMDVAIGDFDSDGRVDIAVANYSNNTVSILRNISTSTGAVSFATKIDYATGGASPRSVSIGDIDGDKKVDLVIANYGGNSLSIFRNTSTGMGSVSFAANVVYTTGTKPRSVSIGDLDGDGKADLAVANYNSKTVSVFRNISTTGSVNLATKVDFVTGTNPASVSMGDLDGDGKADLALANEGDNSLSILRNTSTGAGSVSYAAKVDFATGTSTEAVSIGDFDGDGKMDLAAANSDNSTVSVILHPIGARQTIASFDPFPAKSFGDPAFSLNATASSGLPVTYSSSNPLVATVLGNTVTMVGYGITTITATQGGDSYYGPVSVSQVLAVGPFPTITSFTPTSGPIGTTVTINGTGFNTTPSNNIVYFGATKATVTAATTTQLTVIVPVGATYQSISVLVNGLIGYSKSPFAITYVGGGTINASSFISKADLTSGTNPFSVSSGDFDGDGKTDFAVVNYGSSTVSVFRNTSSSTGVVSYANKIDYATGSGPNSLSVGDLDGDGKVDLAFTNYTDNTVSVYRNTSTGPGAVSFAARVDYATGTSPRSVSIGDLDGDGRADLAIANYSASTVSILRNAGTGVGSISFDTKLDYVTDTAPYSVSIADIDGDGKVDLATANYSGSVSIFLNKGSMGAMSFNKKVDYTLAAGSNPIFISNGDFDGDGKTDLAVANYTNSSVSILRNLSTAGAVSFAARVDYNTGVNPFSVSIGDLNGDGKADLVVAHISASFVSIFQNTSTGAGSVSYAARVDYAIGTTGRSVSIGDFDGDGRLDLATANGGNGTMSVILHNADQIITFGALPQKTYGDAAFQLTAFASSGLTITYASSNPSVATVVGNTVTLIGAGSTIITASQNGNGSVGPAFPVSQLLMVGPFPFITNFTPTQGPVGTSVTINGSGFNPSPGNNIVYFGATRATVTSASNTQLTVNVPLGANYQPISVLANRLQSYSGVPFISTYPGWGTINATSFAPKTDFTTSDMPSAVASADLDMDGKADLIVSNSNSGTMSVLRNSGAIPGAASFEANVDFTTGSTPLYVAIGDIDADGKLDVVVANSSSNTISVFRNTSTGPGVISFASKIDYATGSYPVSISIGDIDSDGLPDIAVYNNNGNSVSIFRNNSSGSGSIDFASKITVAVPSNSANILTKISMGDIDGDGKIDLVVPCYGTVRAYVFPNASTPGVISYSTRLDLTAGGGTIAATFGDLDGDGKQDLVVVNKNGNTASVFKNTSSGAGSISFAAKADFTAGGFPGAVSVGDMDGDGKLDIVAKTSTTISILKNTRAAVGSLSFAARVEYTVGTNPYGFVIEDLDNDGKSDIAVANNGSNSVSVLLHKTEQAITFNPIPAIAYTPLAFPLTASVSSGLPITYTSSNPAVATVAGNMVTLVGIGSTVITASVAGNSNYTAANDVSQTLTVIKADQIITFNPITVNYGDAPLALSASATSGLPITYTSSAPSVATVIGGILTIVHPGTVTITASQAGNANFNSAADVSQTVTIANTSLIKPLYNGNITAASWRTEAAYATSNNDYKGMFLYSYDDKYQFQDARFAMPDFALGTFALTGNDYRETGFTYDPNGNIKTLKRYDANGNKIHDLTYNYFYELPTSSPDFKVNNQLQNVKNGGASFRDYHYNEIGQMTTQDNSTNPDQYVEYDVTGKVTDVYTDNTPDKKKITHYTYDDRGFRLSKETYDDEGHLRFTTWYIRDASGNIMSVYNQQANDTNITLEETPIYGSGKLGVYRPKSNGAEEYVYELTDHLGNVRATIKNDETVYLATMEDTRVNDPANPRVTELEYFTNVLETEKRDPRMNHTLSSACGNCTPEITSYLNWTAGDATPKAIGVGITLKVEAGDQLNLEAYAKYQNAASYTRDATTAMMAGLLSGAFVGKNGLESITTAAQDFANGLPPMLVGTNDDESTKPYAYLNYMVFDKNFVFLDGGAARVPDAAGFDAGLEIAVQPQRVFFDKPVSISQQGFIYVWVSNESANTQVWWDDLKVTHSGNRVTQATDYYAFGSEMRTQTVPTEPDYKFGYQGKYAEKDNETGWNHFQLREFDPIIGRTTSVDPKRQYYSPYTWVRNNPITGTDPTGGEGMDDYTMDESGKITKFVKTEDNYDRILNEKGDEIYRTANGSHFSFDISHLTSAGLSGTTLSSVETLYTLAEGDYDHLNYRTTSGKLKPIYKPDGNYRSARAAQFGAYSKAVKGFGIGLSVINVGLGSYQIYNEINSGTAIDPMNATQVTVGSVGLVASVLSYVGIGGTVTATIGSTAGTAGVALAVPGLWYMAYKPIFDMQYISTPDYPSDSEVFGGHY